MTCISPQLELAANHLPLVQEACRALGLDCNVDNAPPADTANLAYVACTEAGRKIRIQIHAEFRITVLDDSRKSYEQKLVILIERLRSRIDAGGFESK